MSVAVAYAEPPPERRRRIYQALWKFEIGAEVSCGEMQAVVLARSRSAMGRESYDVRMTGEAYGRPYRVMPAVALC